LGTPVTNPTPLEEAEKAAQEQNIEIVYFRGFSSGGPNTNRGFPLRGIAPYGIVPFLNPATAAAQVQNCPTGTPIKDCTTTTAIPIAGLTLWELSNEVRFDISGPFSASLFCDMGDVSPYERDFRFNRPHMSVGAGARYDTPVGPIRFDVGYRIERLQVIGYPDDYAINKVDPSEGIPPRIFALPLAIAVGIGEAF
jgi:outer membrane protein insertion porin family/translocation and assembly module TamA